MLKYYIVLFICVLMISCKTTKQEACNPGNTPPAMPFKIKEQKDCIDIKESKGASVLGLFISKNGTVKGFNILQLRVVKENSDTLVNYAEMKYEHLSYDDYPDKVKVYYPFVEEFVNALLLEVKKDLEVKEENFIYMNVKIGCN